MTTESEHHANTKIMIVDDTTANLDLLNSMLRRVGYRVQPAPSGALALSAAELDPPDLILLDIKMPIMNGFEVCQKLKANPRLRDIPVIFISALTEAADKVKALEVGGIDFVSKPFQFEEIKARIELHLRLCRYRNDLARKNSELDDALEKLKRTQAYLVDAIEDGVWDWDLETGKVSYSDRWGAMLGYPPGSLEPTRETFENLLFPEDRERILALTRACIVDGTVYDCEFRMRPQSGGQVWIRSRGRAVDYDRRGQPQRMIGTHTDITARKEAELQLKHAIDDLSRSNQELEQFAYVASHDLQEPIRMIISYLQLLEEKYAEHLDDRALQFMQFAVDGAHRMRVLIKDLLTLSQIGGNDKTPNPVDCRDAIQDAILNLDKAIAESHAQIEVEAMPSIVADRTQLTQLFQNLIANSIKFRSEKPLVIHISADHEGDSWHFLVQDNGIGIDPQYRERVFVIFQRLHGKLDYSGTGIGLALCKKIVERRGGKIWLESKAGLGATVHVVLPEDPEATQRV